VVSPAAAGLQVVERLIAAPLSPRDDPGQEFLLRTFRSRDAFTHDPPFERTQIANLPPPRSARGRAIASCYHTGATRPLNSLTVVAVGFAGRPAGDGSTRASPGAAAEWARRRAKAALDLPNTPERIAVLEDSVKV